VYSRVDSSCIDSVLAQRGGLPITMAILHRAVGRRAGLDIELINMPGHVINRVQVLPGSGGGSSSSGAGTTAQSVYVDAFYGLVLDEAGLRCVPHSISAVTHHIVVQLCKPHTPLLPYAVRAAWGHLVYPAARGGQQASVCHLHRTEREMPSM